MSSAAPPRARRRWWRYGRVLTVPLLLWALVVIGLREPLRTWLRGEEGYDRAALEEWLLEARGFRETLPEMVQAYRECVRLAAELQKQPVPPDDAGADHALALARAQQAVAVKRDEIQEHLQALGEP